MCTVTLIPQGKATFVLTSNRDEAPNRNALSPDFYTINNTEVLLPKDQLSGGSWIGISDKKRVVCLLNGGFLKHNRKPNYRHSRGIVVNDLLTALHITETIKHYNFKDIEPFTIVIADWQNALQFFELVWDGTKSHFKELNTNKTYIWSSATLYTPEMKQERQSWFSKFKNETLLTPQTLLAFHKTAGNHTLNYGTIMDRGHVKTTSITQISKLDEGLSMRYESLKTSKITTIAFNLLTPVND